MTPEVKVSGVHYDTVDINIIPDQYVVWIVDIWEGNESDPATQIDRYIGVWRADVLEDDEGNAKDPVFLADRANQYATSYRMHNIINPAPLHWDQLETPKKADEDARRYRQESEQYADEKAYRYGSERVRATLYQQFMAAIEVLGQDPSNEEAWQKVEEWRMHDATKHER